MRVRFVRRSLLALLLALVLPVALRGQVEAVEAIGITVSDADRAAEFFATVLTFEKISDIEVSGPDHDRLMGVFGTRRRIVRMRLGEEILELTEFLSPADGRPVPVDSRSNDRWFQHVAIIVSDMDRAYARLREHRVRHVSPGPQLLPDWNPGAGGIEAFYFQDPDGHVLEILAFPADKGAPRWHRPTDRLFLGIDHTAIVVGDTERSLGFYRDALGMTVAGEGENWGPEQERLNSVFGARLRITSLRAAAGPAIELLEYLAPPGGRPMPADTRAHDLWSWRTRLRVASGENTVAGLRRRRYPLVSPGWVEIGDPRLGFTAGGQVRDPDGHAVVVVEG